MPDNRNPEESSRRVALGAYGGPILFAAELLLGCRPEFVRQVNYAMKNPDKRETILATNEREIHVLSLLAEKRSVDLMAVKPEVARALMGSN